MSWFTRIVDATGLARWWEYQARIWYVGLDGQPYVSCRRLIVVHGWHWWAAAKAEVIARRWGRPRLEGCALRTICEVYLEVVLDDAEINYDEFGALREDLGAERRRSFSSASIPSERSGGGSFSGLGVLEKRRRSGVSEGKIPDDERTN